MLLWLLDKELSFEYYSSEFSAVRQRSSATHLLLSRYSFVALSPTATLRLLYGVEGAFVSLPLVRLFEALVRH